MTDPTAITGTWTDVERRARYLWHNADPETDAYEMAEAVLVLLGQSARRLDQAAALLSAAVPESSDDAA